MRTGRQGEDVAARYLRRKRYRIEERNFRCRHGEIDLVAIRRDTVVFVEVKTRQSTRFGMPQEAVSAAKQTRIARVAQAYLQQRNWQERTVRFDVIAVRIAGDRMDIDHIEHAFEAPAW